MWQNVELQINGYVNTQADNVEVARLRMDKVSTTFNNPQADVGMGSNTVGRPRSSRLTAETHKPGLKRSPTVRNLANEPLEKSHSEKEIAKARKKQAQDKKDREGCGIQ